MFQLALKRPVPGSFKVLADVSIFCPSELLLRVTIRATGVLPRTDLFGHSGPIGLCCSLDALPDRVRVC